MMFDARHPAARSDHPAVHPHFAPAKLAPEVLAKVGETYAAALSSLQRRLAALAPAAAEQRAVLDEACAEVGRLEQLGVQIQEIARVLAGDGRADPETFDAAAAARQVLAEWAAAAQRRGVRLHGPTEPLPLYAVAGVVEQLLELAIDYALRIGRQVTVGAAIQGQPAHPMLTVQIERADAAGGGDDEFNDLQWLLFSALARASGLAPQRLAVGTAVTLMLGFPGVADGAEDLPRSAALLPRTPVASGRRVLLLEPRDMPRIQALRLMRDAAIEVEAVATLEQARGALRDCRPDVLVTGIPAEDPACAEFVDELRAAQPRLRVIELVDDDSAFAFSLPGTEHAGRVGRGSLARTLVPAISQELDAALERAA